jgi:hypothetical protein
MSDILKPLLQACSDKLDVERQSRLSYIARHIVTLSPISLTAEWESPLPLIVVYPIGVSLTPDSFEGTYRSDRKIYSIGMAAYVESYDGVYGVIGGSPLNYKSILDVMIDIEAIFNRETFGLSQACVMTSASFSKEVMGLGINSCVMSFDHSWIDRRLGAYE